MEKVDFANWVEGYIRAWNSNDPDDIGGLFTEDAVYYTAPYRDPWRGREGIVKGWLGRKDEPGTFSFEYEILAVSENLGVLRGETRYTSEKRNYSNIWTIELNPDGRCSEFTEWWMEHD